MNVANWTFGSHVFSEVFGGECEACTAKAGKSINHLNYLDDRNYDYVVMQSGPTEGTNDTTFLSDVENIMNIFKAGNPNTKFVLLVPYTAYGVIGPGTPSVAKNTLNNLKTLANQGVTIVDWGGLVMDILNGKVQVPNAMQEYTKNTFVVAQKASDGFHPNLLSGYITTLMTYAAITGDTAQGKAYAFCNDATLNSKFDFEASKTTYYKVGDTNFDKVFASQTDMSGIQGLIDSHLSTKAYMNYHYQCDTCKGELTDGKCATCDNQTTQPTKTSLDGKKVIFIGNSYTYYGRTVVNKDTLEQNDDRKNKGYFYQLCKENGMNVEVTNWVFGGHNIRHIFSDSCTAGKDACSGKDHKSYLTDRYFDYVVLQPGVNDIFEDASSAEVNKVINFFKEANPNVKFVLSVPYHCYGTIGSTITTASGCLNGLKTYADDGMIISDWGGLIMDILNKKVQVPNSTLTYEKNTFVIAKSTSDGYHPNLLTGCITSIMTFCAITGESAQGQPYDFFYTADRIADFKTTYYTVGTTNFDKVFASQTDMLGIQGLIDQHISAKAYMKYSY